MFKAIDIRSVVIGGLLVLVVLGCLGALPWLPQESFGRFTITTTDRAAFIFDTATGQAWVFQIPADVVVGLPGTEEFFSPKLDPNTPIPITGGN